MPRLPSEYAMRRTARPARTVGLAPVPGATSNLTNAVTWYVPLALDAPPASNVCHVPPPVTSSASPRSNVPAPVTVICDPSLARADALPPGDTTPVAKLTLMRSQLNLPAACGASSLAEIPPTLDAAGADVGPPFSQARASPITATAVSPTPSTRVFIVPPCLGGKNGANRCIWLVQRRANG